jgi:hypothetical protein
VSKTPPKIVFREVARAAAAGHVVVLLLLLHLSPFPWKKRKIFYPPLPLPFHPLPPHTPHRIKIRNYNIPRRSKKPFFVVGKWRGEGERCVLHFDDKKC